MDVHQKKMLFFSTIRGNNLFGLESIFERSSNIEQPYKEVWNVRNFVILVQVSLDYGYSAVIEESLYLLCYFWLEVCAECVYLKK